MSSTNKILEITKAEVENRQKHEQFINISRKICDAKQRINTNDIQYVKYEKDLHDLQTECRKLKNQCAIDEAAVEFWKNKVMEGKDKLDDERKALDEMHNSIWTCINEFAENSEEYLSSKERKQYLPRANDERVREKLELVQKEQRKAEDVLKLKGEIEAMQWFNDALVEKIKEAKSLQE